MNDERTVGFEVAHLGELLDTVMAQIAWMGGGPPYRGRWTDPSGAVVCVEDHPDGTGRVGWFLADAGRVPLADARLATSVGGEPRVVVGRVGTGEEDGFELAVLLPGGEPAPPLPAAAPVAMAVVGVCRGAAIWPDEATYRASQPPQRSIMAVESLVALGLTPEADATSGISCEVFLTGVVVSSEVRTNHFSGRRFVRAVVRTWGVVLTLTFAEDQLAHAPAPGAVVQGTFNLVGSATPPLRASVLTAPESLLSEETIGVRTTPGHLFHLGLCDGRVQLSRTPLGAVTADRVIPLDGHPDAWDASDGLVALAFTDHVQLLDGDLQPCYLRPHEPGWRVTDIVAGPREAFLVTSRPRPATPAPSAPGMGGERSWDVRVGRISVSGRRDLWTQLDQPLTHLLPGPGTQPLRPAGHDRRGAMVPVATVHEGGPAQLLVHLEAEGAPRLGWWFGPPWLQHALAVGPEIHRSTTGGVTVDHDPLIVGAGPGDARGQGALHEPGDGSVLAAWSDGVLQVARRRPDGGTERAWVPGAPWCTVAVDGRGTAWWSPSGANDEARWPLVRSDGDTMVQVAQLANGAAVVAAGGGKLYVAEPTGRTFVLDTGMIGELELDQEGIMTRRIRVIPDPVEP